MSRYWDKEAREPAWWPIIRDTLLFVMLVIAAGMYGCPQYNVWQQGLVGKAALERAIQDRQIKVQEAQAAKDSAVMYAEAEVSRAHGVAKANQIIGESLKGNESYLRYLWINNLQESKGDVIYIPTEGGLPILEANRFGERAREHP